MEIINESDFIKAAKLGPLKLQNLADPLMRVMGLKKLNTLYGEMGSAEGLAFVDAILDELNITIECDEEELKRIPKEGGFLAVANHPFGGLDGLVLLKLLGSVRPDIKIVANHHLSRVTNISNYLIEANPFNNKKADYRNVIAIRKALTTLKEGTPVALFPAGEVSAMQIPGGPIEDRKWNTLSAHLIEKTGVPVLPVYFRGKNSFGFHLLGLVHSSFRTALLPSELLNKQNTVVKVRIGKLLPAAELKEFESQTKLMRYLRARTYALGSGIKVESFFKNPFRAGKPIKAVASEAEADVLNHEINHLRENNLLIEQAGYEVFCAKAEQMPNLLQEIGRLRELTFREVGEGTNASRDIDDFDLHYHHLFIWDRSVDRVVGAYRIGKGLEILSQYGKNGFYLHSLFKIKKEFTSILERSLELGRSFIRPDYQRKPLPLLLLWKGVLTILEREPHYRFLIGPVTISDRFSKLSKHLIITFIKRFYFDESLSKFVVPRKKFRVKKMSKLTELFFTMDDPSVQHLESIITDIEPEHKGVPVLLKKYIKQNGRIIGFNLDPHFNQALDGFLILDVHSIPPETMRLLQKPTETVS